MMKMKYTEPTLDVMYLQGQDVVRTSDESTVLPEDEF